MKADNKYIEGIEKHQLKNGEEIYVEIKLQDILFYQKRRQIVIAENRTEKVIADRKIQELNQELEKQVEKRTSQLQHANNELEAFNYTVSHDLRSPIRNAIGLMEIIEVKKGGKLDDECKELFQNSKSLLNKAHQQIHDLLAFSVMGKKEKHLDKVDMEKLFSEISQELKLTNPEYKNHQLRLKHIPKAYADLSMIKHVVFNLLSNAFKFSSKEELPSIEIGGSVDTEQNQTTFYVKDNGVGFEQEYEPSIYKVFKRLHTEREFSGNGAGLAITERIVSRHGGELRAESQKDLGATFHITLPGVV